MSEFSDLIKEASKGRVSITSMLRELRIGKNFIGRSAREESSLRAFRILQHLFRHGANGPELLAPPVDTDPEGEIFQRAPLLPFSQIPSLQAMEDWMSSLTSDSVLDDRMLQYCTVYDWPRKPSDRLVVRMVGRSTLVALEAGALSVRAVQSMIDNSPDEIYSSLRTAAHEMNDGQVSVSQRIKQTLYVPPDYFVFCAIESVKVRLGNLVINFPRQQGRTDRIDPEHEYSGNLTPAIMAGGDLQRPEPLTESHLCSEDLVNAP